MRARAKLAERSVRVKLLAGAVAAVAGSSLPGGAAWAEVREHCAVAAHRGDWSSHTQNGLPAMRSAIELGADYLEADLRLTRDEHFVLMHNAGVKATTNGIGRVADKTLRRIERLRLDDGSRVPTLAQLLETSSASDVHLLIDVKVMGDRSTYRDLVRQIRAFGLERVRIISSSTEILTALQVRAPEIPQGLITRQLLTPDQVAPYDSVVLSFDSMTVDWLDSMPYPVYAWTVNDEEAWNRSDAHRLAAVITDAPKDFLQWRENGCPTEPSVDEVTRGPGVSTGPAVSVD